MTIFSASQVSLFESCQAKWGFRYLDGIEAPPHPSAELGTQVHAHLEAWLRDATPIPNDKAGEIAFAGVHLLPAPKTKGMTIEDDFVIEIGGVPFRGFIDVKVV